MNQGKNKILYIQPYNWQCGPNQSLLALVANLDPEHFIPLVVFPKSSPISDAFIKVGAEVYFDPGIRIIPRSFSPTRQLIFWGSMLSSINSLAKLITTKNMNLVHVNSEACWVGAFAAMLANLPALTHLHGLSILSPPWVGRVAAKFLNKFNRALIATSFKVKREYIAKGTSEELIRVIYNGVDVKSFTPGHAHATLRSELGIKDGQSLIGMIANFDARKGHHLFVASCALVHEKLPHAKFVIVGDTKLDKVYYQRIRHLLAKLGLLESFHILGVREDIPNILMSLDVVVQPSLTEAGPIVPIETMAMERPIIVTDVGGNSEEVVDGQTGLVVPVGNVHALSDAILRLLSDLPLARRLGKLGRQRVLDMFTEEAYVCQVQKLYEQLLLTKQITGGSR